MPIAPGRAAADALLSAAERAGANRAIWLTRTGARDIETHYGPQFGQLPLHYHAVPPTNSTLETVHHGLAAPELALNNTTVALGFPDMQFREPDALNRLREELDDTGADVVLGCFVTDRPDKVDTVDIDAKGLVREIRIKSSDPASNYAWILALWRPTFTRFLANRPLPAAPAQREQERYIGHELQAALAAGFTIRAVEFDSPLLDIGTPDDLARASTFWDS